MIVLDGVMHDGETSRGENARLQVHVDDTAVLICESGETRFDVQSLDIPSRLGDTVRRIHLPGGAVFETSDNDAVDDLVRAHRPERRSIVHTLERKWIAVITATAIMLVSGVGFVVWGVPALAKRAAFAVSTDLNDSIGQGTLELLDEAMAPSELLEEDRDRLRARFAEITDDASEGHDFELVFRRGERFGANAFALPSGTIVLTDELVDLAEHEDEIIAVLAHETGHVVHRHGLRHVIQSSALAVVIVLVTGDLSSTSGFVAAVPTVLVESSFSREFEREADDHAVRHLVAHDIPLSRFATILQRLGDSHGEQAGNFTGYLSSHPATDERIERLEAARR